MLAFKDVIPYPEILGYGTNKIPKTFKSDYFRFLSSDQKKLYFAILESEVIESANNLIQQLAYYPKSGVTYNYYFNSHNSTRFPLDYFFFEEYVKIYKSIIASINSAVSPDASRANPRTVNFYYNLKMPILLDDFAYNMRDFIANSRLESINDLTSFFEDYINFKQLRYKNYYNFENSKKDNIQYESKLIQSNRIRRAKILSNYFRVAKAANKQSLVDYHRNSISLINPYKSNSFYLYANIDSFSKGIEKKKMILVLTL